MGSLLAAEKFLDSAEYEVAGIDIDAALALISLYKSLGVGWNKEQMNSKTKTP
jgi:outer membrane protein TolC